jgi:hypothetical protein
MKNKEISPKQIDMIMSAFLSYNIGVKDYQQIGKMFESLPEVMEVTQADVIPSEVTDH